MVTSRGSGIFGDGALDASHQEFGSNGLNIGAQDWSHGLPYSCAST
jgi:hypothetical protein